MNDNNNEKIILVAKMYTGEYIEQNIGHEIINFFKPDCDDYFYGYIIYNGKVKECDKIDTILLVSDIKNRKMEILAKINKPEFISNTENNHKKQINYIEKHNIKYGNVLLTQIMQNNGLDEYGIYITYRTKNIAKPQKHQYILLKDSIEKEDNHQIKLSWNIGHNLGYISNKKNHNEYEKLANKIKNIEWNEIEEKRITEDIINEYSYIDKEETFMDIINRKYDENVFSNMLYYYLYKKGLFKHFAKSLFNIELSSNTKIYKEKSTYSDSKIGRIDLFVEDTTNKICIIIENKLKSAINGRYYTNDSETNKVIEKSQLYKYMKWVETYKDEKEEKYKKYKKYYYIFVPNYKEDELKNDIEMNNLMPKNENNDDLYRIITYKEIFDFFNSKEMRQKMCNDKYYTDFINSLSYHIYTADKEMERKFVNAIRKVREKNNGFI